jgi:hypothetical protein
MNTLLYFAMALAIATAGVGVAAIVNAVRVSRRHERDRDQRLIRPTS